MTRKWLSREYVEGLRSAADIAREVNCSTVTVINTLHRFGLPVRDGNEDRVAALRKSNKRRKRPTAARKLSYRQRRQVTELNAMCAWCGSEEDLEVHHRDADRGNDSLSNLVVLCHYCHAGVEWFIGPVERRLRNNE